MTKSRANGCGYLLTVDASRACNAETVALSKTVAGRQASNPYYIQEGIKLISGSTNALQIALKSGMAGYGAATSWNGSAGDIPAIGLSANGAAITVAAFQAWDEYDRKEGRKSGLVDLSGGNHIFADGEEQFGLSMRKFLPDVGTGVDLGFHVSQYDSKVPYLRIKGQQGIMLETC